jgi:hypothetical protein
MQKSIPQKSHILYGFFGVFIKKVPGSRARETGGGDQKEQLVEGG